MMMKNGPKSNRKRKKAVAEDMTTQFPGSGNGQPRALTAKRKAQKILVESRGQDRGRQAEPGVVENLATRSRQDVQGQSRLIASQRKNPGGLDQGLRNVRAIRSHRDGHVQGPRIGNHRVAQGQDLVIGSLDAHVRNRPIVGVEDQFLEVDPADVVIAFRLIKADARRAKSRQKTESAEENGLARKRSSNDIFSRKLFA